MRIPLKLAASHLANKVDDASLPPLPQANSWLDKAVEGLRKSGTEHHLPRGLLARACYYRFAACIALNDSQASHQDSLNKAKQNLQEARDIAQRGGMKLFLTDYHLESARLALTLGEETVFDLGAAAHVAHAEALITDTGYHRRDAEVAYLNEVINT